MTDAPPLVLINEDQIQIQKWVHDFAEGVIRPVAEEWDEREEFPWPVVEEAAQIGLYGVDFLLNAMRDQTGLTLPVAIEELFWGDAGIGMAIMGSGLAAAGIDVPLRPGETSGTEGERFEWTVSVQDYQPWPGYRSAARGLDAYRVTVTVEWPHGDNTRSVGLSTVRLRTEGGVGS